MDVHQLGGCQVYLVSPSPALQVQLSGPPRSRKKKEANDYDKKNIRKAPRQVYIGSGWRKLYLDDFVT